MATDSPDIPKLPVPDWLPPALQTGSDARAIGPANGMDASPASVDAALWMALAVYARQRFSRLLSAISAASLIAAHIILYLLSVLMVIVVVLSFRFYSLLRDELQLNLFAIGIWLVGGLIYWLGYKTFAFLLSRPGLPPWISRLSRFAFIAIGVAAVAGALCLAAIYFILTAAFAYVAGLPRLEDYLSHYIRTNVVLLVSAAAIVFSLVAYFVRCNWRLSYGLLEFLFGIAAVLWSVRAFVAAGDATVGLLLTSQDIGQVAFQLVASVYITIRGLNNIEDGLKQNAELLGKNKFVTTDFGHLVSGILFVWWKRVFYGVSPSALNQEIAELQRRSGPPN